MTSSVNQDNVNQTSDQHAELATSPDAQPDDREENVGPSLQFKISYLTAWGQQLRIVGNGPTLGSGDQLRGYVMSCRHSGRFLEEPEYFQLGTGLNSGSYVGHLSKLLRCQYSTTQ